MSYDKTDKNVYLVRVPVQAAAAAGCASLWLREHETDKTTPARRASRGCRQHKAI